MHRFLSFAMHFPVGMFTSWLMFQWAYPGLALFAGFMVYELNEDVNIHDKAYNDIFGFLVGFAFMSAFTILTKYQPSFM